MTDIHIDDLPEEELGTDELQSVQGGLSLGALSSNKIGTSLKFGHKLDALKLGLGDQALKIDALKVDALKHDF